MYIKHAIVGMYCETPLHAGSGQAVGVVDLPVQREKTTNWPTIQASGLKGAFRSAYEDGNGQDTNDIFGSDKSGDQAGAVSIGDARLLLFPVRSSCAPFLWVTCPAILQKLKRDGKIVGKEYPWTIPDVQDKQYLGLSEGNKPIIFEDLMLTGNGPFEKEIIKSIKELVPKDDFYNTFELEKYLCLVSDTSFSMLVETGTEVQARIVLDNKTKTSNNLWYQELVPSNTVFYTVISMADARRKGEEIQPADVLMESLKNMLMEYIQIGGDETLGRGWTRLVWQEVE
ncbi:MAG: type III-B CRISPR module RAMP protein Cmr4 [Syntrophus sp. (in: bacteria)]|nr:type III-B CRISPR module RAMP protein Cmr4 [Syntrophus sp. (in: bacteria)]